MASIAKTEPETSLIEIVNANPVLVLTDRAQFSRFYQEMRRETDALEADVSTDKGRRAIAAMAYKVARTKTAIDEAGKKLNEEARAKINAVDEARREIRQQLDALKDEVRLPLTEWEAAEEKRLAACQEAISRLRSAATVSFDETEADVRLRLSDVQGMTFDEAHFGEFLSQAVALRDQAISALTAAVDRLAREESERVELDRLRAEATERERLELERRAREQEEREEAERQANAERQRKEAEEAEANRLREAEERAAQAARDEEARKAREAETARAAEHQAQLAEERAAREAAERTAREEQDRRAAEEAEKARQAEEDRKREENRAHRTRVQRAAKEAIMTCGADEDTARKVVLAIIAGEIPNVTLRF